jgi:hypothetical protein
MKKSLIVTEGKITLANSTQINFRDPNSPSNYTCIMEVKGVYK